MSQHDTLRGTKCILTHWNDIWSISSRLAALGSCTLYPESCSWLLLYCEGRYTESSVQPARSQHQREPVVVAGSCSMWLSLLCWDQSLSMATTASCFVMLAPSLGGHLNCSRLAVCCSGQCCHPLRYLAQHRCCSRLCWWCWGRHWSWLAACCCGWYSVVARHSLLALVNHCKHKDHV